MKKQRKWVASLVFAMLMFLLVSGCANNEAVNECLQGRTYNFWGGLWHGIIAPVDFFLMLFRDDITVYAPNNNGAWYALGFLIGSGCWGFMSGKGASRSKKA